MNRKKLFSCVLSVLTIAVSLFLIKPINAYAGIVVGGGGSNPGSGGSNDGSCGGSSGVVCPMTLWVYYTINDRSRPAYIGSHAPYANSITISDCGPYGGFWIYQRTANEKSDKNTLRYRVASGARMRSSPVNAGATSSTMIPLKGVYNDENSNVTPSIPGYPDCASSKSCTKGGDWLVSEDTVKDYFRENNGGSTWCTIGNYSGDCFSNSSPLTYFCYGDDPEHEVTNHLYYNKNTSDNVSSMPNTSSCTCTTRDTSCSCNVTVRNGTPSRSGYNFKGWNDSSAGNSTNRSAGSSISISSNKTIYAKWAKLYSQTLQYSANGGSGAPGAQSYGPSESSAHTFTVSSTAPTRTGYKFLGWSTSSTASSASYTGGSSISVSGTTTLYAVWKALDVATFTAPEITISSTELTHTSGNNWKGLGNKTKYSISATYHVKRTNGTPASATSYYGVRSATSDDNGYPTNSTLSTGLANNGVQDIPRTYSTPEIANGNWHYNLCFYFKYDSEVYYDGNTRIGAKATATTKKCVNVYNPGKYNASFSGSVSISNGAGLTGSGATRTGSGYKSTFTVTPNYSITRTDGLSTPTTATSYYAINSTSSSYNGNHYPADSVSKTLTGALGIARNNKTQSWSGSASTVNINIGGATQHRCFYLRFDSSVLYYDNARQSGNFAGKTYSCVSITNPSQSQTISFTGAPVSGTMTANSRLTRTDSNRTGTIINHDRNTSGTLCGSGSASVDSKIGKWCDNATARTANYTADFSHKIARSDNSSTILGKTMNAKVSWKVQHTYPNATPYISNGKWVVTGTWSDYPASQENARNAVSNTTSLGASGSVTINTQPKLTADQGQIRYYCQRIAYTPSITYHTISVSNRNDYGVDGGSPAAMTTYTSPLCVTLKNPAWRESDGGHLTHEIHVTARPHDTEFVSGQFTKTGSGANSNHETMVVNPTIYVTHTVSRDDTRGADESDPVFSGKYYQRTIYSAGDNLRVTTNLSGYQLVNGLETNHHLEGVTGGRALDGSLAITLGARSKTSSDSITTNRTAGASALTFNATGLNKYSLMAGQTRTFNIESSIRPAKWTFEYKKINLTEYYTKQGTGPVTATGTTVTTFDRIEKHNSTPVAATNPAYYNSSAVTFSVNRPYNFKITSVTANNIDGVGGQIAYDDDSLTVTYTVNIDRENTAHAYITDPNHTDAARYVYPVSYILPANISSSSINSNAAGVHSGVEASNICAHFNGIAKAGSCVVYSGASHPNKLSASESAHDPNAKPSAAIVDTIFRHVYPYTNSSSAYQLKYTTGSITIENPNHTPLAVGEKFCTALAIRNYSSASNAYFVSPSSCRNISKRPSLQILGSSIISTGGIDTSESTYQNTRFGSWTDFAVIAGKNVKRMNSGATAIGGIPTTKTICERSPLTIANTNCSDSSNNIGNSNIAASTDFVAKLFAYFVDNADLPNTDLITAPNKTYIIRTDSDLTISHNIINNHPNSQVIIMARNINIHSNVTRLDAWLVAATVSDAGSTVTGGTIDTCSNVGDNSLSADTCTNRLTINGQLYGGIVKLKRTTGGDPAEGSGTLAYPAEIVNYSPSTYIWGATQASSESNPRVVYTRKLPTRY